MTSHVLVRGLKYTARVFHGAFAAKRETGENIFAKNGAGPYVYINWTRLLRARVVRNRSRAMKRSATPGVIRLFILDELPDPGVNTNKTMALSSHLCERVLAVIWPHRESTAEVVSCSSCGMVSCFIAQPSKQSAFHYARLTTPKMRHDSSI